MARTKIGTRAEYKAAFESLQRKLGAHFEWFTLTEKSSAAVEIKIGLAPNDPTAAYTIVAMGLTRASGGVAIVRTIDEDGRRDACEPRYIDDLVSDWLETTSPYLTAAARELKARRSEAIATECEHASIAAKYGRTLPRQR